MPSCSRASRGPLFDNARRPGIKSPGTGYRGRDDPDERRCLIALHLVPALGPIRIARLVQAIGSARAASEARETALAAVPGIGPRLAALIVRWRRAIDVDEELRRASRAGACVLTWLDADYPARLRELDDAPPVLYLRGSYRAPEPAVAVVGTRSPSAYGLDVAGALGEVLGGAGVVVVSGLARGVDAAAHAGALRQGGSTVAVLGCGVDVVYPREHRSLMEAMLARGGIVSEAPMGVPPRRQQFPLRNRLISGLAQAVVVVEGGVDSGSLITARHAARQGRPVYAVPGSVFAPGSRGPHRLLASGARVLGDPGELLQRLGVGSSGCSARPPPTSIGSSSAAGWGSGAWPGRWPRSRSGVWFDSPRGNSSHGGRGSMDPARSIIQEAICGQITRRRRTAGQGENR
ncbi:MAG: DNA-protecting protein DprA [Bacillati bacterium ANGP1]|uniref:DNA-protecting protein DprA n=1 Tax=Candidatus Segetimicrobium genomatis TaxID=2569760 RepID=A0A537J5W6_9BACT|nr:MAG: DNA-protecting protein DprA [Terrabacteria group bacterium ANGP1]